MSLVREVAATLHGAGIRCALIGAAGMAVHGIARSTVDIDLLVTDRAALRSGTWSTLRSAGCAVDIRHGDASDPLAGVVTVERGAERPVDVIVGEAPWQRRIVAEARPGRVADAELPVATPAGLVLLKLYAGGPGDQWDIHQLLAAAGDPRRLREEVTRRLDELPGRCRALWNRILSEAPPR